MAPETPGMLWSLQLFSTLFMTGLIWFVQVVFYPMFAYIGPTFEDYHRRYTQRISWIVAPMMGLELVTTLLYWWQAGTWASELGLALVTVLWLSTAFVQMPLHKRLQDGYHERTLRSLVRTNWLRTAAWTGRALLLVAVQALESCH